MTLLGLLIGMKMADLSRKNWSVAVFFILAPGSLACSFGQADQLTCITTECYSTDYSGYNMETLPNDDRWCVPESHTEIRNNSVVWSYHTNVTGDIGGYKLWLESDTCCLVLLPESEHKNCFWAATETRSLVIEPLIWLGKLNRYRWESKSYLNISGNNIQVDFRLQPYAQPATFSLYLENGTLTTKLNIKNKQSFIAIRGLNPGKYYFQFEDILSNMTELHCPCRVEALGLKQCLPCDIVKSNLFQIPGQSTIDEQTEKRSLAVVALPIIIFLFLVCLVLFCCRRQCSCNSRSSKPAVRVWYTEDTDLHSKILYSLCDVLRADYHVTLFKSDDIRPVLSTDATNYAYEIVMLGGQNVQLTGSDTNLKGDMCYCLVVSHYGVFPEVNDVQSFYMPNDLSKLLSYLAIGTGIGCPFSKASRDEKKLRKLLQLGNDNLSLVEVDVCKFIGFSANWVPANETDSIFSVCDHAFDSVSHNSCHISRVKDYVDEDSITIGEKSI